MRVRVRVRVRVRARVRVRVRHACALGGAQLGVAVERGGAAPEPSVAEPKPEPTPEPTPEPDAGPEPGTKPAPKPGPKPKIVEEKPRTDPESCAEVGRRRGLLGPPPG